MYDVTTAISRGQRDYQEDSVVADFNLGNPFGFAVLADGMGGHAAGDVASKIVVTEVFSELKFQFGEPEALEKDIATVLQDVARSANDCINAHVEKNPGHEGMGATLVAPVLFDRRLYWISIGDSPLYLFRKGVLTQLNEDHSMAPQIDVMVKTGQIDEETARNHPDRNCLTSVLMGDRIPKIDCRVDPTKLQAGDILVVASDGVQFLTDRQIQTTINRNKRKSSSQIAEALLGAVHKLKDPDQDNISLTVVKIT
ncbi:PP2C family protein-serine/threonine phosphatase [Pseudaestuariivita rosea]|uniref:PP2C family protein-serine/threonine phosphatase n=1 Tax=Pseudaestuariivita rosea TaxID=2763263 RepID=UPI0030141313